MKHKSYMTISEFARITGIKRANLIFYDNIGLLSPEFRKENDYRCYTRRQLDSAYLITSLRDLGLGLDEIRRYAKERTPEKLLELLAEQEKRIQSEINRLRRMGDMMSLYMDMAREGIQWNTDEIIVREQNREPIFLGPPTDPMHTDDENSLDFYQRAAGSGMVTGYPLGCVIAKHRFLEQLYSKGTASSPINWIHRYYFKVKQGQNNYKPQGLYVVACGFCGYGQSVFLYEKLARYVEEHDLRICGDAYEEYLLNEMATQDDESYLTKVELMVAQP